MSVIEVLLPIAGGSDEHGFGREAGVGRMRPRVLVDRAGRLDAFDWRGVGDLLG